MTNKERDRQSKKVDIQTNKYLDRMMDRQYDANMYFFDMQSRHLIKKTTLFFKFQSWEIYSVIHKISCAKL